MGAFCRLCGNITLHAVSVTVLLAEQVQEVAGVQVRQADGLPATLCEGCSTRLEQGWAWRLHCQAVQARLHNMFTRGQTEQAGQSSEEDVKLQKTHTLTAVDDLHLKTTENFLNTDNVDQITKEENKNINRSLEVSEIDFQKEIEPIKSKEIENLHSENTSEATTLIEIEPGEMSLNVENHEKDEQEFKCDESTCEASFSNSKGLKRHKKSKHGMKYKCDDCNLSFKHPLSLRIHKEKEARRAYRCEVVGCLKRFKSREHARGRHLMTHTVEEQEQALKIRRENPEPLAEPYVKLQSSFTLDSVQKLAERNLTDSEVIQYSDLISAGRDQEIFTLLRGNIFQKGASTVSRIWLCDQCPERRLVKILKRATFLSTKCRFQGTVIEFASHFSSHLDKTKTIICEICDSHLKPNLKSKILKSLLSWYRGHLRKLHFKDIKCEYCGKIVPEASYKSHLASQHGVGNKFCSVCEKKFSGKGHFDIHVKTMHTNRPKEFVCEDCGNAYYLKGQLQSHIKAMHSIEALNKAYMCDKCDFRTSTKSNLECHFQRHEEKKYQCHECSKFFKTPREVIMHFDCVHRNEENCFCDICGKSYRNQFKLRSHKTKVHKNTGLMLTCDICPAQYKSVFGLKLHKQSAHEKKRFPCNICSYEATQKTNLKIHMKCKHKHIQK